MDGWHQIVRARREEFAQRLLRRRVVTSRGCWEWSGSRSPEGYGRVQVEPRSPHRQPRYVHIVAAVLWLDFDPATGLQILHDCDNPPCFCPQHLHSGTQRQNSIEAVERGRIQRGPRSLTAEQVRAIRSESRSGVLGSDLAARYGVSTTTISNIINDKRYPELHT